MLANLNDISCFLSLSLSCSRSAREREYAFKRGILYCLLCLVVKNKSVSAVSNGDRRFAVRIPINSIFGYICQGLKESTTVRSVPEREGESEVEREATRYMKYVANNGSPVNESQVARRKISRALFPG